ncbi:Gemin6 protein [Phytophthora infestans]|uniref:Gemin6 protein n=1 Tax=Phytophthora infestans TaxID=4787 RepID=A0A833TH97_PHYIN|nr:Gemin6 protein [Phytophthora infestans]KAF4136012.1 Gemin6 protein [Phytophthora infestans]
MGCENSLFDQFSSLIGQPVRVHLQDGTHTNGVLYCIDPETDHVALLCPGGSGYNVKIVLAHHVRDIAMGLQESTDIPTLILLQQELEKDRHYKQIDTASIQRRREQLGKILTKNFVSFEEAADGSVRVFGGAATVRAPFRTVECANELLLRRMQQLLEQLA